MKYYVIYCNHCGKPFYRGFYKGRPPRTTRCPYCKKAVVIFPKRQPSRIIKIFNNPHDAKNFVEMLKLQYGGMWGRYR